MVPTYKLVAKEIRLLGKFQPDSFRTERLVCVETDGQTDMARSTRVGILIKNIYTLWGRKCFPLPITYFPRNVVHPFTPRVTGIATILYQKQQPM